VLLAVAVLLTSSSFAFTGEEQEDVRETFEAFAIAMGTSNPPVTRRA